MIKLRDIFILGGARTPIGHFAKSLRNVPAVDLGAIAIKEAIIRSKLPVSSVENVIMGAIHQEGMGNNPARIASLKAGIPYTSGALTINNVCSSGMKAIELASLHITMGNMNNIVAGGMESNSQCPYLLLDARWGYRLRTDQLVDALFYDGFTDTYGVYGKYEHIGETAENIIEDSEYICNKYNLRDIKLTIEEVNQFALKSHKKYIKAQKQSFFKEIVPINFIYNKKRIKLEKDECPREDITLEQLNQLGPAFRKNGMVTAGNTPSLNDGAAALVLTSRERAENQHLRPLGKIIAFSYGNVEPEYMGIGPIPAIKNILTKTNKTISDIDFFEINEAQSQQVLFCIKALGIDIEKVNVNGGAIAIGHPPGMTGTRLILTALYNLKKRNKRYAVCSQCAGGGTGMAVMVENLSSF